MSIPAPAKQLLDFIGSKEAPRGYDTVFGNRMDRMPKPLTTMTVEEAIAQGQWRTNQFGSSACGRYQFMKKTLQDLKGTERLSGREVMTSALQDRLGYALLVRRGYARFMAGQLSVAGFGLALAQEWASFPVLAATRGAHRAVQRGQTYYLGDGLNKVLATAGEVETVLRAMRAGPILTAADAPVVVAPRVDVVPAAAAAEDLPWWARLLGRKPKPIVAAVPTGARPGLKPGGSSELWDVQRMLRDRRYYTKGFLDGLDGPLTESAVAQSRKDNGLRDGGIDAAFIAALPTMPQRPVPSNVAAATLKQAAAHAPEVFNPLKWVATLGAGAAGIGGADSTGLFDQLQSGATRFNDVAGSVQGAIGVAGSAIGFIAEHRGILLVALGLYLLFWAGGKVLDAWIKVRQAFF